MLPDCRPTLYIILIRKTESSFFLCSFYFLAILLCNYHNIISSQLIKYIFFKFLKGFFTLDITFSGGGEKYNDFKHTHV